MKQLSIWAKNQPRRARWLIALGRTLAGTGAVSLGIGLGLKGFDWAETAFQVSAWAFVLGVAAYPSDLSNRRFALRKGCDTLLVVSSLTFWLGWGNWRETQPPVPTPATTISTPSVVLSDAERASLQVVRERLGAWSWKAKKWDRKALTSSGFWDADDWLVLLGAICLTILIAALALLVISLSCNLSCNGQEGAAAVVLILGALLVFTLLFLTWRWAALRWRANKRSRRVPDGARRVD